MRRTSKRLCAILLSFTIVFTMLSGQAYSASSAAPSIDLVSGLAAGGGMSWKAYSPTKSNSGTLFLEKVPYLFDANTSTSNFGTSYYQGPHIVELDLGRLYTLDTLTIYTLSKSNTAQQFYLYTSETSVLQLAASGTAQHSISYADGVLSELNRAGGQYLDQTFVNTVKSRWTPLPYNTTNVEVDMADVRAQYVYLWFGSHTEYSRTTEITLTGEAVLPNESVEITFDANGADAGTAPAAYQGAPSSFSLPGNPGSLSRTGYTFGGWGLNAGVDQAVIPDGYVIYDDITFYAIWIANDYTLTFDYNDGETAPTTAEIRHLYPIGDILPSPERAGYMFDGWFTSTAYQTRVSAQTAFTGDTTLYAKWSEAWKLTFQSNGGSDVPVMYVRKNQTASPPAVPTRHNYVFAGWYLDAACTQSFDWSAAVVSDLTLYAKWAPLSVTVGGQTYTSVLIDGETVTYTGGSAHLFDGETAQNGYIMQQSDAAYEIEITLDILHRVGAIELYTGANGDFPDSVEIYLSDENGDYAASPAATVTAAESGMVQWGYPAPADARKVKLVCKCEQNAKYRLAEVRLYTRAYRTAITYHANGGAFTDGSDELTQAFSKTVADTRVTLPAAPQKAGKLFGGWYYDNETFQQPFSTSDFRTDPISLWAKWVDAGSDISLTLQNMAGASIPGFYAGGTAAAVQLDISYLTALQSLEPSRAGYRFDGWYADVALQTPVSDGLLLTTDCTLYAKWTAVYHVNFYADAYGTPWRAYTYEQTPTANLFLPTTPSSTGRIFEGWTCEGVLLGDNATVTNDMEIYPQFGFETTPFVIAVDENMIVESSAYALDCPPVKLFDGLTSTPWRALSGETAYFVIDLGAYYELTSIKVQSNYSRNEWMTISDNQTGEILFHYQNSENDYYQLLTENDVSERIRYLKFETNDAPREVTLTGRIVEDIEKYWMHFEMGGGEPIESQLIHEGCTPKGLDPFHWTKVFAGWYTDAACTAGNEYDITEPVTQNRTIWAKWYTIPESDFSYTVSGGEATIVSYNGSEKTLILPATLGGYPVTAVADGAFRAASAQDSLRRVIFSASIRAIGDEAFCANAALTDLYFREGLQTIGDFAFHGCMSLPTLTLPQSVTSLGEFAFGDCYSLTSVSLPDELAAIPDYCFSGCTALPNLTLPDTVASIGEGAFYGCLVLTQINLPAGVTAINDYTFASCRSLSALTLPESLETIGASAFFETALTTIVLPETLTAIGREAFSRSNLTQISIPAGVTSLSDSLFAYCASLQSVALPNTLTTLGDSTFLGCTSLTAVNLPQGVTIIANRAFYGCTSMTQFAMGSAVTHIGNRAFFNDAALTSLTLPSTLQEIGEYAFYGCSQLTGLTAPAGVTKIGNSAFNLTGVNYSVAKRPDDNLGNYFIDTVYADIDWANTHQYKSNLHAHSVESDGSFTTAEVLEKYYERGYEVLALTDHNFVSNGVDVTKNQNKPDENLPTTTRRMQEILSGAGRTGNLSGMQFLNYAIEQSNHSHINTFGVNFVITGSNSYTKLERLLLTFNTVTAMGGFFVQNHPGWVYPTTELYELAADDPQRAIIFAEHHRNYGAMVGCEPINKGDGNPMDRATWDRMLSILVPDGRYVWGYANDDSHVEQHYGISFNWLLMPSNSQENIRTAMETGASYYSSKYSRCEIETTGTNYVRPGTLDSRTPPVINSIAVNQAADSITLTPGSSTDYIKWFTGSIEGSVLLESVSGSGSNYGARTININNLTAQERAAVEAGCYVRAIVVNSDGVSWTQPIGVFTNGEQPPATQSGITYLDHTGADVTASLPQAYADAKQYTHGSSLSIPEADPYTREDFVFDGWYDAPQGGARVTAVSGAMTGPLTLYARFYQIGDISMDGALNAIDVVLLSRYMVGKQELSSFALRLADMNSDQLYNAVDVTRLSRKLAGK